VDFAALPEPVRNAARRHFLDSLGACLAGIDQPLVREASALVESLSGGGKVAIAGTGRRSDLLSAVYLMAVGCHAIELDDGNREGSIHPGTVVVPAVLGLGYHLNAAGADVLSATVAGYEAAISLAEILHPHASRRGFQTTGVVGVVGAAAAAGRLLGLDALRMEKAMGIAASSGAGLFAYLAGGGNIKKLHPAHAAREGVFAALLANHGDVDGPRAVAESPAGIFHAFGGLQTWTGSQADARPTLPAIARSYTKPYPCCRHIHPAIDALLQLRARHGFGADDVKALEVGTYGAAMPHAALGWDSFTVAQLSFPYVMAAALRYGRVDLGSFSDRMRADPALAADAAKVRVTLDPACAQAYPKQGPARVAVVLRDGRRHEAYVADPRGSPELPMSDEELFDKFRMTVQGRLSAQAAGDIIGRVWKLESAPGLRALVDSLSPVASKKATA
jgi:2-methylcitrate dehydratase PrpD